MASETTLRDHTHALVALADNAVSSRCLKMPYQLNGEMKAGLAKPELEVHLNQPVDQGSPHFSCDLLRRSKQAIGPSDTTALRPTLARAK